MGGFSLLVKLHWEGSTISGAILSSLNSNTKQIFHITEEKKYILYYKYPIPWQILSLCVFRTNKLDRVAPLMTDPPPTNSTTMHRRLVCEDRNLCLGGTAYLPGPTKTP